MSKKVNSTQIIQHLPWLIPLVITLLGISFQIYSVIGRIEKLEERSYVKGEVAIRDLGELDYRVRKVEEIIENKNVEERVTELEYLMRDTMKWCCDEIKDK
jgi:hypothetical protein